VGRGTEIGPPKIVTAVGKESGWVGLGKDMLTCEGWRVRIELG